MARGLEACAVSFTHLSRAWADMTQRLASAGTDNPIVYTGLSMWLGLSHSKLPAEQLNFLHGNSVLRGPGGSCTALCHLALEVMQTHLHSTPSLKTVPRPSTFKQKHVESLDVETPPPQEKCQAFWGHVSKPPEPITSIRKETRFSSGLGFGVHLT